MQRSLNAVLLPLAVQETRSPTKYIAGVIMRGFSAINPIIEKTTGHRKTSATPIFVTYLKPFRTGWRSPGWRGASGSHEPNPQKYRRERSRFSRHHYSSFPQCLVRVFYSKRFGLFDAQKKGTFTGPLEGLIGGF
jgi:hypothetical protein